MVAIRSPPEQELSPLCCDIYIFYFLFNGNSGWQWTCTDMVQIGAGSGLIKTVAGPVRVAWMRHRTKYLHTENFRSLY